MISGVRLERIFPVFASVHHRQTLSLHISPFSPLRNSDIKAKSQKNLLALISELKGNGRPESRQWSISDFRHCLVCYASLFQILTGADARKQGQQVHAQLIFNGFHVDGYLGAKIIAMYGSCGDLCSARRVFDSINMPNSLSFNSLIRGYSLYGRPYISIQLFREMLMKNLSPDYFTFPFVLKASAELSAVRTGKCLHSLSLRCGLEFDIYVGTSLVDMYVKCGEICLAQQLFDVMPQPDVSSWNALIAGYMKYGQVSAAEELFDNTPSKNIVSWTAMVSGYSQNGLGDKALSLFKEMAKEDSVIKPNRLTVISVLPACAHFADLQQGIQVHSYVKNAGLENNPSVQMALSAMYARCGSLCDARRCFDQIHDIDKGVVAWNTMITGYASHGKGSEARDTFDQMISSGVKPDDVTFIGLLSGCSHAGLVSPGLKYFQQMHEIYNIAPGVQHYACLVDMLGRAGRLVEASQLIESMEIKPGPSVWGALLSACKTHKNLEVGELAARHLFVLEPENIGNYVILSNMYAEIGRWDKVDALRILLKEHGMKKNPGCSWIEINGKSYVFIGGDTSHPQAQEVRMLLDSLPNKIKEAGYVPDTSSVLHDVTEEEKENALITHSEKLAVAYGLLNTSDGMTLRVNKNLRTCGDCHMVIKFISKIYSREIIMRDINRFHHFRDGCCSCRDYW